MWKKSFYILPLLVTIAHKILYFPVFRKSLELDHFPMDVSYIVDLCWL